VIIAIIAIFGHQRSGNNHINNQHLITYFDRSYSASTSVGFFAIELTRASRSPSGKPYRIFATASKKNHPKLLSAGVEAVFDYRSETWPEDVRKASGGISYALDCISEDHSTAKVSQTYVESGGVVAVIRSSAWHKEGIRENVTPIYSAVWSGLGHEIVYNGNGKLVIRLVNCC
jgi:NADPH:quinone reductase-like Zn-dependent oxidoreductase